jgi:hypothetical protein
MNLDKLPPPLKLLPLLHCERSARELIRRRRRRLRHDLRKSWRVHPGTYDRASQHVFLDNTDVRYADTAKILGLDVLYGVTVNNNPTVQDVWNTTPAWGFPYIASTLAPAFAPPLTMIESGLGGKVIGTGAYTFWNDMLYLEVSVYQNLSAQTLRVLGEPGISGSNSIGGAAPYWRAAFEYDSGDHSLEVGTFGMSANQLPGRVPGFGFDQILDIGFDAQYQYIGDPHSVTVKLTHINENQQLNSTFLQGGSSNLHNTLESFKASVGYVYDHTYSLTAAYFDVRGSADAGLFTNSLTGSPDGQGLIFDAAYLPFSKDGPAVWPWLNARIGVSYTHYLKLFGGSTISMAPSTTPPKTTPFSSIAGLRSDRLSIPANSIRTSASS